MRKDLNPLLGLHRSALVSLMQKSASDTPQDNHFQYLLSAFTKKHVGEWLKEYWKYRIGRKHPFQTWINHSGVFTIPNSCKMSVAGDWGTGTDEAFEVGRRILESQPDYTIHLGDVYYVGSELEVMENFLGNAEGNKFSPCTWPRGRTGSLALSGNHEMYARGFGYFDSLLPTMNVNGVQQEASYFCLENDHWRILGLDTGYNSVGLPGIEQVIQPSCELTKEQIDWVGGLKLSDSKGLINTTPRSNRRTGKRRSNLVSLFISRFCGFGGMNTGCRSMVCMDRIRYRHTEGVLGMGGCR